MYQCITATKQALAHRWGKWIGSKMLGLQESDKFMYASLVCMIPNKWWANKQQKSTDKLTRSAWFFVLSGFELSLRRISNQVGFPQEWRGQLDKNGTPLVSSNLRHCEVNRDQRVKNTTQWRPFADKRADAICKLFKVLHFHTGWPGKNHSNVILRDYNDITWRIQKNWRRIYLISSREPKNCLFQEGP